jgi:tetratricopeptide (TPR) repeat protein
MKLKVLSFGLLLSLMLLPFSLVAQSGVNRTIEEQLEITAQNLEIWPAWLITEKGRILRQEGRLSEAFTFFFKALEKSPADPTIEIELARSFLQSGDIRLTRFHLQRALEKRNGFASPEMVYDVYYFLADLAFLQQLPREYEQHLRTIVEADSFYFSTEPFQVTLRNNIQSSFMSNGLDRTLILYRIPEHVSLDAHRQLGVFYTRSGRYDKALPHLLFAVMQSYSRVISEVRNRILDFEFTTLANLHRVIQNEPGLQEYLSIVHIYESLYFLAEALFGLDRTRVQISRAIWNHILTVPQAQEFHRISTEQIRNPRTFVDSPTNR